MDMFDFAIQMERDGYEWYSRSAQSVQDVAARKMLESLADDEKRHEQIVTQLKANRTEPLPGQPLAGVRNVFQGLVDVGRGFFNENDELAAVLKKGIEIENKSVLLYRDLAGQAPDPNHQRVCQSLMAEEKRHEKILSLALEYIDKPEMVLENAEFLFYGYDEAR